MPGLVQKSFLGGEVTEALWSRTEQSKRAYGLKRTNNVAVTIAGGMVNRPGTERIVGSKTAGQRVRCTGFTFGGTDSAVLEIGEAYMRFAAAGVQTTVTTASDAPAWLANKYYVQGDLVTVGGVIYYCFAANVNQSPPNTDYWYALSTTAGTAILEIPTPWTAAHAFELDFDGYGDVRFFAHPDYTLRRLTRVTSKRWVLEAVDWIPSLDGPTNIATSSGAGAVDRRYKITAIKKETREQSLPGNGAPTHRGAVDNTGAGGKLEVTVANAFADDDDVVVTDAITFGVPDTAFEAAVIGKVFNISNVTGAKFDLDDTANITAPMSGPTPLYELVVTHVSGLLFGGLNGGTGSPVKPLVTSHGLSTGDEIFCVAIDSAVGVTTTVMKAALERRTYRVTVIDANNFALDDTDHIPLVGGIDGYFVRTAVTDAGPAAGDVTLTWSAVPDAVEYWIYKESNGVFAFLAKTTLLTYTDDNTPSESVPLTANNPPVFVDPTRRGNPEAVAIVAQRLALGGGDDTPLQTSLSQAGNLLNFSQDSPLTDRAGFFFDVRGYTVEAVRHLMAVDGRLLLFTGGDVWLMGGNADGTITPDAPNLGQQSFVGSGDIQPLRVGRAALFIDRFAGRVHQLGYDYNAGGWMPTDLSLNAPHLLAGRTVVDWCYQQTPEPTIWMVRDDGVLLGMTYDLQRNVYAWHRHSTGASGLFKSVCCVPESEGHMLYAFVERTINGSTATHLERFRPRHLGREDYSLATHAHFVDCGKIGASVGTAFTVPHLPSTSLAVLADGVDVGPLTSNGSGVITLPQAATEVHAGIPIDAYFSTIGADQSDAPARKSGPATLTLLLQQSKGFKIGPDLANLSTVPPSPSDDLDAAGLESGWVSRTINTPSERHGGSFTVRQQAPLPLCVLAAIADLKVGGTGAGP